MPRQIYRKHQLTSSFVQKSLKLPIRANWQLPYLNFCAAQTPVVFSLEKRILISSFPHFSVCMQSKARNINVLLYIKHNQSQVNLHYVDSKGRILSHLRYPNCFNEARFGTCTQFVIQLHVHGYPACTGCCTLAGWVHGAVHPCSMSGKKSSPSSALKFAPQKGKLIRQETV